MKIRKLTSKTKLNLVFLILFFPIIGIGQNLTLDEILSFRNKDLADVEEYLTVKGWDYIEGEKSSENSFGTASFGNGKVKGTNSTASILTYFYSQNSYRKRISIQITNKEKYNNYISKIKTLGFKLKNSKVVEGEILKLYQGKTTTIEIRVANDKFLNTGIVFYTFFIVDNLDYQNNFSDRFD